MKPALNKHVRKVIQRKSRNDKEINTGETEEDTPRGIRHAKNEQVGEMSDSWDGFVIISVYYLCKRFISNNFLSAWLLSKETSLARNLLMFVHLRSEGFIHFSRIDIRLTGSPIFTVFDHINPVSTFKFRTIELMSSFESPSIVLLTIKP